MSKKGKRILANLNDARQKNRLLDSVNKNSHDERIPPVGQKRIDCGEFCLVP